MKKYRVRVPIVVFSITGEKGKKDYSLLNGDTIDLPADNHTVRALVASRKIEEVQPEADEAKPAKPKK